MRLAEETSVASEGECTVPIQLSSADAQGSPAIYGHPIIACDHCGHRVRDAASASVAWGPVDPTLRYVHGDCLAPFIDGEFDSREGKWRVGNLGTFLYTLLDNVGYDREGSTAAGSGEIPWGSLGK
jgi:hypothetical protein